MCNCWMQGAIVMQSELNENHEVIILPITVGFDTDDAWSMLEVAKTAYEEWFAADDTENPTAYYDAIGSYIEYKLREAGWIENEDYYMFFGDGWEAES